MKISRYVFVTGILVLTVILFNKFYLKPLKIDAYYLDAAVFERTVLISNQEINHVELYLIFPAGEALNPYDEGMAHYVEHLAWLSAFQNANSRLDRHANAWTTRLSTGYSNSSSLNHLRRSLRILLSVADPLKVELDFALEERDIVLREYDFRASEQPLFSLIREMDMSLYGEGGLGRSLIGRPSEITEFSLNDARALHTKSHVLSQATLLVYGNVLQSQLLSLLESFDTSSVTGNPASAHEIYWANDTVLRDSESLVLDGLTSSTFLYRKLIKPDICDDLNRCEMIVQIAEHALGSSLPGGVAGPLRFDQFVARSFSLELNIIANQYIELGFSAQPDIGVSLKELQNIFETELLKSLELGIPAETFDRVVSRLNGGLDSVLERDRPAYNRDLALAQINRGKALFLLNQQRQVLKKISVDDVNHFLKSLLHDGRTVIRRVQSAS